MEQAGIDVISDGEQGRESYFNRFANALGGIDPERPGRAIARLGRPTPVPRVVGPIERVRPVSVPEATFLRSVTDRRQLRELEPIVDGLQLDEPYLQAHPDRARAYGIAAIDRALAGLVKPTCIHLCFGYAFSHALAGSTKSGDYRFLTELERSAATQVSIEAAQPRLDLGVLAGLPSKTIVLGVLDLGDPAPETADTVARRLEAALEHVPPARLVAAPDCGMKYLARDVARAKLAALAAGAARVGRAPGRA